MTHFASSGWGDELRRAQGEPVVQKQLQCRTSSEGSLVRLAP